jgi:predicted enzyme related to lactoylglutathione lyase
MPPSPQRRFSDPEVELEACSHRRHSLVTTRGAVYVRCTIFSNLVHRLSSHAVPLCLDAARHGPVVVRQEEPDEASRDTTARFRRSSSRGRNLPVGRLVYTQIAVSDLDRAQAFYEAVFGWCFEPDTVVCSGLDRAHETRRFSSSPAATVPAGSLIRYFDNSYNTARAPEAQGVVTYIEVEEELAETMSRVEAAGGTVVTEQWEEIELPLMLARFMDTEGNVFGLVSRLDH